MPVLTDKIPILLEDSLAQLQEIVRQKLGLQSDAVIKLSQVRGTADVDLEDGEANLRTKNPRLILLPEDDFDAFYNAAHSASTASIRVTIQTGTVAGDTRKDEVPSIFLITVRTPTGFP